MQLAQKGKSYEMITKKTHHQNTQVRTKSKKKLARTPRLTLADAKWSKPPRTNVRKLYYLTAPARQSHVGTSPCQRTGERYLQRVVWWNNRVRLGHRGPLRRSGWLEALKVEIYSLLCFQHVTWLAWRDGGAGRRERPRGLSEGDQQMPSTK